MPYYTGTTIMYYKNSDNAMCADNTCPSASSCLRHSFSGRVVGEYQTWSLFDRGGKDKCSSFISVKGHE